ncbi:hypothetical protein HB852_10105 [Listeria grandensis]|uniref:Lipoprotein n=1 Tax=Listeria grandensis TaxID=1494963 RepID=A0A7X0Y4K7_9LIST|nr:hypothetical protein [Listeria grandensis]MBC1474970.1 hypothetical protein [Listeria grandensis]MBC1936890.1 hypothetical protein [Listeria grandensis]
MIRIAIASLLLVSGCSTNEVTANNKMTQKVVPLDERTIISSLGKYTSLASNLAELENTSPVIVEVTKNNEKQTVIKESEQNSMPTEFYTMSSVTIKDIQKDASSSLKVGDKIEVMENVATDVLIAGEKRTLTFDYYKKMNIGNSYYLYLRNSTSGDNYVLTNAFLSKYPVNKEPTNELFLNETSSTHSLENLDYQDLYEDLYTEILQENK